MEDLGKKYASVIDGVIKTREKWNKIKEDGFYLNTVCKSPFINYVTNNGKSSYCVPTIVMDRLLYAKENHIKLVKQNSNLINERLEAVSTRDIKISNLESQIKTLSSHDATVKMNQELLDENKSLRDELAHLKEGGEKLKVPTECITESSKAGRVLNDMARSGIEEKYSLDELGKIYEFFKEMSSPPIIIKPHNTISDDSISAI